MSVPIHIRQVARPKNTVVVDTGHDGAKRYAVRERRKSVCGISQASFDKKNYYIPHLAV